MECLSYSPAVGRGVSVVGNSKLAITRLLSGSSSELSRSWASPLEDIPKRYSPDLGTSREPDNQPPVELEKGSRSADFIPNCTVAGCLGKSGKSMNERRSLMCSLPQVISVRPLLLVESLESVVCICEHTSSGCPSGKLRCRTSFIFFTNNRFSVKLKSWNWM